MSQTGTELNVKAVTVTDDVAQLCADCNIVIAPSGAFNPPSVEFSNDGDSKILTGSTIRPTGVTLSISATYSTVAMHTIFRGLIEYMDDLTDANKDEFKIKMSAMPRHQPNRKPITMIFDNYFTDGAESTTSRTVLKTLAANVALEIGRNDLVDYVIVGSWDVVHQTVVQAASALVAPFNHFDFLKYYVRTDADGLQIMGIDFSAPVRGGVYDIPNIISCERSYELYMPDERVGDGDVLLTGGDITVIEDQSQFRHVTQKVFFTSSQDNQVIANFQKWTERRTTIEFVVDVFGSDVVGLTNLDQYILALQQGDITDLKIVESYTLSDEVFDYDSVNGLERSSHTYSTYEEKTFVDQVYLTASSTRKVLTYDETQEYLYPEGQKFNKSLVRRYYQYNKIGTQTAAITYEFFGYRDQWNLNDVRVDNADAVGVTNSEIQFYAQKRKPLDGTPTVTELGQGVIKSQKVSIGKYQLLNGQVLPVLNADLLKFPFDPNTNFALLAFDKQNAFQLECPGMNYDGLQLIWTIVQRQRELERTNAYWEIIKVVASIDTAPVVGTSAKARGAYGIVTAVEHSLDPNQALTTLTLKRLHQLV